MVRAVRPNTTSTNAQVSGFYFRPCHNEYDEVIPEYFRYRCGTASAAETGSVLNFVRHSSRSLYGWMHWIIESNLPLSFCEIRTARRYSKLDPISEETLRLDMSGVTQAVERMIAEDLPSHFGVMFDGVTHASEHYVAWFACFERNGELVTVLLGMAPLLNEPNDDLSA
ncbi:hypothetical protein PC110_g4024 [Phytophthora cactorum]|uniref:Uncharacterized protein n=1 Tax=Phytophthora cactorum TaxID=29920 RepID=A0A329SS20_9STRA|nr:hypothetical protein PC110_g4024 [Phytophthora cactorum]